MQLCAEYFTQFKFRFYIYIYNIEYYIYIYIKRYIYIYTYADSLNLSLSLFCLNFVQSRFSFQVFDDNDFLHLARIAEGRTCT